MVVRTKKDAKEAFGSALNAFLDGLGLPNRGRPRWVYNKLRAHARGEVVSYESCRKWIRGLDIPEQANQSILCEAIGATRSDLFPETRKNGQNLKHMIHDLYPEEEQKVIGYIEGLKQSRLKRAS